MGCFLNKELQLPETRIEYNMKHHRCFLADDDRQKLVNNSYKIIRIKGKNESVLSISDKSLQSKFACMKLEYIASVFRAYSLGEYRENTPTSSDILDIIDYLPKKSEKLLSNVICEMLKYDLISCSLFHVIKTEYANIFFKHLELKADTLLYDTGLARMYCLYYPKIIVSKVKILNQALLRNMVFNAYLNMPVQYVTVFTNELISREKKLYILK